MPPPQFAPEHCASEYEQHHHENHEPPRAPQVTGPHCPEVGEAVPLGLGRGPGGAPPQRPTRALRVRRHVYAELQTMRS